MSDETTGQPQGGGQPGTNTQPAGANGAAPPPPAAPPPTQTQRVGVDVIPPQLLAPRLAQERKRGEEAAEKRYKEMLAQHGITDLSKLKSEREASAKELETLRAAEEKRKRDAMSREEQLSKDNEALAARVKELEEQLAATTTNSIKQQQNSVFTRIAGKYIKGQRHIDAAVEYHFKNHVIGLSPEELKQFDAQGERAVERWFRNYARENPELALNNEEAKEAARKAEEEAAKPPAAPPPKKIVRRPVSTGAAPPKNGTPPPAGPNGGIPELAGKDPRPGRPNSMTKAEVAQWAKAQGYTMPR